MQVKIPNDKIIPEYEFEYVKEDDNIYESMVMAKRASTVLLKRWSEHEDELLKNLVKKNQSNWVKISMKIKEARRHNDQEKTPTDCCRRWISLQKQKSPDWSKEEDNKLLELVASKG